jgi:hypothetical protein
VILFWRETHLNECYIFHSRFQAFLSRVQRSYRKDARFAKLTAVLPGLQQAMKDNSAAFEAIRGEHVHQYRHRHRDAEMERLALIEILAVNGRMTHLNAIYRMAVSAAKRNTVKKFAEFNRCASRDLNFVFKLLCQVLLSAEDRLIYPAHLKIQAGDVRPNSSPP